MPDSRAEHEVWSALLGEPSLQGTVDGERLRLAAAGPWTVDQAHRIELLVDAARRGHAGARGVTIDVAGVERLDTYGAWLLERLSRGAASDGRAAEIVGVPGHYRGLLDELRGTNAAKAPPNPGRSTLRHAFELIGRSMVDVADALASILRMFGTMTVAFARVMTGFGRLRMTSAVHHLDRVGWRAVPIVLLITFLIGCIIAQQGIFHFRRFGADIFVVDMIGILVLREIGVLLVCIMVAGRSGSAYTAELGAMKMREEIDALRTMGFDPVEVLVLPRIVALIVAVPILTFLGAMAALYGGGLVCWLYGDISPDVFISRLREAITFDHFLVGMIKAPFMALIIGVVACVEGLAVKGSADSLGLQTTTSVVKSIFLVIVLDGLFAIFFAAVGM
jgi:phospholipid/cholesterol/gamma-HCH transport system permease protein